MVTSVIEQNRVNTTILCFLLTHATLMLLGSQLLTYCCCFCNVHFTHNFVNLLDSYVLKLVLLCINPSVNANTDHIQ